MAGIAVDKNNSVKHKLTPMRRGRPPIPKSEKRSIMVNLRVTRAEFRRLKSQAKRAGVSVSEYARQILCERKVT